MISFVIFSTNSAFETTKYKIQDYSEQQFINGTSAIVYVH